MSNRVSAVLAAFLYLMVFSQLHAEIWYQSALMYPKAGELIPTPTFFLVAKGGGIPKALALSDGDLYLAPLESNQGPEVHSVPLAITQRYRHGMPYQAFLELNPSEPLVLGVSYELRGKAGTAAELVEKGIAEKMDFRNNPGQVWKVVSPAEDGESPLHTAAPSIARYAVEYKYFRGHPFLYFVAVQGNEADGILALIPVGKDKDEKLLRINGPGMFWTGKTILLFTNRPCSLDPRSWTDLRGVETILLGARGERSKKTIPVRVNPVATSVFSSLLGIHGESSCKGGN